VQVIQRVKKVVRVEGFSTSGLLRLYLKSAICSAWFRARGVQSPVVSCQGRLPVLYSRGQVSIGERFAMRSPLSACELGADHPDARLEIGDRVFINQGATVVATSYIKIGDDTLVGEFSAIYDTNHHGLDPLHPPRSAPVVIGNNVWLCRGVVVLPGSTIGDHTVVAVGSVVNGDLPPRVLAAGNPAQVVRKLDIPDHGWSRHEAQFLSLSEEIP
jgi:acetyltransferase-like isoleucine patch superfamily enzyme